MKLATALLLLFASTSAAHASTSSASSQKLLGWSKDGKTWAVLTTNDAQGTSTIDIVREGKVVFQVCNRADNDPAMGYSACKKGPKTATVSLEERRGRSGLERVDIVRHRALKKYDLQRVSGKWRKAFKAAFMLRRTDRGDRPGHGGGKCAKGWTVTRRADNKIVKKTKAKRGCLTSRGGYLHPNGKLALVKATAYYLDDPDEGMSDTTEDSYSLVQIP